MTRASVAQRSLVRVQHSCAPSISIAAHLSTATATLGNFLWPVIVILFDRLPSTGALIDFSCAKDCAPIFRLAIVFWNFMEWRICRRITETRRIQACHSHLRKPLHNCFWKREIFACVLRGPFRTQKVLIVRCLVALKRASLSLPARERQYTCDRAGP